VFFPAEVDRGDTRPTEISAQWRIGKTWRAETIRDGTLEFEYRLRRGDQPTRDGFPIQVLGRGQKNVIQDLFVTAKALLITVDPEKSRIAPGGQTRVFVRLLKIDDKKVKEPVKGRTLTLRVTGLEDGKIEPKDKTTTDENGLGTLTYTAGERDKTVRIEASYQPDGYETRFTAEGTINAGEYIVTVDLDVSSPFVADGRMTIAGLGMHVVFEKVFFDAGLVENPLAGLGRGWMGRGEFTRFALNDVHGEGDDRHRPWFTKGPPKAVTAQITMAPDVGWLERMAIRKNSKPVQPQPTPAAPAGPPATARLAFMTTLGLSHTAWRSHLGSAVMGDLRLRFDVPWNDLLAGNPVTLTVPYEADAESGDKGTWTITFTPKSGRR
jgi:hypothetical protein